MRKSGRNLLAVVWVALVVFTIYTFTLKDEVVIHPPAEEVVALAPAPKPAPVNLRPPSRDDRPYIICYPRPANYSGVPPVPPRPDMSKPVTMLPIATLTLQLHDPETPPMEDLEILQSVFEEYRRGLRENPVAGLNEEVVEALVGVNLKRIGLIPADHPAINAKGQLTDRWGTPFFFHPMSAKQLEIKSAGPDRKWNTEDDLKVQ